MNYKSIMKKADRHHTMMSETIKPLADKVREFLGDDHADIFYQTDGWCIVFGYMASNTPVGLIDFKKLFSLSKEDAVEYLEKYSI